MGNQGSGGKSQPSGAAALAAQKAKAEEKAAGASEGEQVGRTSEDTVDDRAAQERLQPEVTDGPADADNDPAMPAGEPHADAETAALAEGADNPPATEPPPDPVEGDSTEPASEETKDDIAHPPGFTLPGGEWVQHQDDAAWLAAAEDAEQQARADAAAQRLDEERTEQARADAAAYLHDLEDPPVRKFIITGHRPLTLGYPKPDGTSDYFPGETVYEHMLEPETGMGAGRLEQLGSVTPAGTERSSKLPQYMQPKMPVPNPDTLPGSDLLVIATTPGEASAAGGPFDPHDHNVQDVVAFGRALVDADQVRELIEREIGGKHRTTLLAQLGEHLEKIELADDAGTPLSS